MPISVLSAADAVARANTANRSFYTGLRATLIGPRAGLHRFSVESERALLGEYAFADAMDVVYPDKAADSTVDLSSVLLYANDARLNYFNKYISVGGSCVPSETYPNRVRAANYIFKTANGYDRSSDFKDRDVKIGDVVVVRRSGTSVTTSVAGFVGEPVASTRSAATADDNNAVTQSASDSITQVAGTPINDVVATVDGSGYDSTDDGYITRTYTVTVTQSSSGGDATTALLRVRSADGLDDQDNVVPSAFGDATAIGTKGLEVTWSINPSNSSASLFGIDEDDFVIGQQWTVEVSQAFTAPTATSGGTYTGDTDDTLIVTVSRGGSYAGGTKPQITVTTANGSDHSGPTNVTAAATPVSVGNYDVTIQFNQTALRKGDTYYITVEAAAEAQIRTIITADDIPESLRGQEVDLRLFVDRDAIQISKNRELPTEAANWSCDSDSVAVEAGIYLTDSEFTDGGELYAIPLDTATLYVQYREWLTDDAANVILINDPANIEALLGPVDVTNPIAQAASLALANTSGELLSDPTKPAANTTDMVVCIPIGGDPADIDLWTAAFETIEDDNRAYDIVVLSTDDAVRDIAVAHVAAQSEDTSGYYRNVWLAASIDETGVVVSAATSSDQAVVTATITADPDASPAAYTIITASSNAGFSDKAVRQGDKLRINFGVDADGNETYDQYTVSAVISNTTLRLATGPTGVVSPARRIEVWRTFTKAELVATLIAKAATYASERVRYVWPDRAAFGGTTYEGYLVCAALAGLAGSVPSQQGLRNVGLAGIDDATRTSRFFTGAKIRELREGGVFVVSETSEGGVYIASASTTDISSVETREEMVVRNGDMLRKAIQSAWDPYVGSGNVVSNLRQLLEGAMASLTASLKQANWSIPLGPPVADIRIDSIDPVEGAPDEVDVSVAVAGVPAPLNQIRVRLPVSIG